MKTLAMILFSVGMAKAAGASGDPAAATYKCTAIADGARFATVRVGGVGMSAELVDPRTTAPVVLGSCESTQDGVFCSDIPTNATVDSWNQLELLIAEQGAVAVEGRVERGVRTNVRAYVCEQESATR